MNLSFWLWLMQRSLRVVGFGVFGVGGVAWLFTLVWGLKIPHVHEPGMLQVMEQLFAGIAQLGASYGPMMAACGVLLVFASSLMPFGDR